jgi:hypothetical protein
MVAEWNKSVSTEATLVKLVTASVMVVAAIGGWRRSAGESYPDPVLAKSLSLKIFIGVDLGILTIPFCESCATIIGLASAISTPALFLLCLSLLPSASHISTSSPTLIYGGTFSASRRKEVWENPRYPEEHT